MQRSGCKGFTLLELVTVLVLAGIVGVTVSNRLIPSATFQLQSSRDLVVTAFFAAQQRAMAQADTIQLQISASQIDIRADSDGDGDFSDESGITAGGVSYPISLLPNQTITPANFTFDRFGKTTAATLTLSQSGGSVTIQVSATGYIK